MRGAAGDILKRSGRPLLPPSYATSGDATWPDRGARDPRLL